jgi:hypothetical protein
MPTRIITDALLRREKPPPKGTRKRITDRHLPACSAVIHPTGAITLSGVRALGGWGSQVRPSHHCRVSGAANTGGTST